MCTLPISYMTTSKLPWFMDLTFQVLCNIVLYSIRLLSPLDISTTERHFHFVPASVIYWTPTSASLLAQPVNNLPTIRRPGLNPWIQKTPGEGNGNSLQHSCLENLMDRGAWQAIVHGIAKSQTWLSDWHLYLHQPGGLIFQCRTFLPFYTVHGVFKARILKRSAIPLSSGPCFVMLQFKILGQCKSNQGFESWNFTVWYWNTFLNKCDYVTHYLMHISRFMLFC